MRLLVLMTILIAVLTCLRATAQVRKNEIHAGAGISVYQSVYSTQLNQQVELAFSRLLSENVKASAGFRYQLKPRYPAGYLRLSLFNRFGSWKPSAGMEAGFSNVKFTYSDQLLQETKEAMNRDLGTAYLSSHIAPLCFSIGKNWALSALEINVGSHFKQIGRTVFVQLNFLSITYSL